MVFRTLNKRIMPEIDWTLRKQQSAERKRRRYLVSLNEDQLIVMLNRKHFPNYPQRVVNDMDKYESRKKSREQQNNWKANRVTKPSNKVKLYGEDTHLKKMQIEMQISELLKEREKNPLNFEIQYKINQLNCKL